MDDGDDDDGGDSNQEADKNLDEFFCPLCYVLYSKRRKTESPKNDVV